MKKLIIYLLCVLLIFQDNFYVYASEIQEIKEEVLSEENSMGENLIEEEQIEGAIPEEQLTEEEQTEEVIPEEQLTEEEQIEEVIPEEQLTEEEQIEDVITEEQLIEDDSIKEAEVEKMEDDPQAGRAEGYIDEDFGDINFFSEQYNHADKYRDYQIRDVIDVSKHQGEIEWNRVKQSGIDYAMIRAGYRGYGQSGTLNTDSKFRYNIEKAISAGIDVGVYFFSQAITEEEAVEEAKYVLSLVEGYSVSLPIAIDFEYASGENGLMGRLYDAHLSREKATRICQRFCEIIENKGYTAMIYANKSMLEKDLNAEELENSYKIWLAHYTNETSYVGKYDFWQYTPTAHVSGIAGNVDKSFWYVKPEKTYAQISEDIYTIMFADSLKYVLDVPNASVDAGVGIQAFENNGTWAQKFYIRPENNDHYIIMSANSGKVLEIDNNRIFQSDYNGSQKQQWKFRLNEDGSYAIESATSGQVLTLESGAVHNGSQVLPTNMNEKTHQRFQLVKDSEAIGKSIKDGTYYIESQIRADKMWNLGKNGKKLEIKSINGSREQKFQVAYVGSGCYQIINLNNQRTLKIGNDNKVFFENQSSFDLNSKWIFRNYENDVYTLISAKSGTCLDVSWGDVSDGTEIQTFTGNGTLAQKFKVYTVQQKGLEDGVYRIHSSLNDQYVLDISNGSVQCDANVQLFQSNGTIAQEFIIKRQSNGSYKIWSHKSRMMLSVEENCDYNTANVLQFFPVNAAGQSWRIESRGKDYYSVFSNVGGRALDVSNGQAKDGTNIQVFESNNTPAQIFRFEKLSGISENPEKVLTDGTYIIYSSKNEGKVLDIDGGDINVGANVQLFSSNNTVAQKFVVQRDRSTGYYTILSKKSGMALSYEHQNIHNSMNVYQNHKLAQNENQWRIRHLAQDYYMIYAKDSNYCMDIANGFVQDRTNIQLFQSNATKAQIFKFVKVSDQIDTDQNTRQELPEGLYMIASALDEQKVLDVDSISTQDWANIQLFEKNECAAQKFIVEKTKNGNYKITAMCSGKLLTVSNGNVCQLRDTNSLNQQWQITLAGDNYYTIKSAQNGYAIDVSNGSSSNHTNIQTYSPNFTRAQRFKFIPIASIPTAKFVADGSNGYKISFEAFLAHNVGSSDGKYYLMEAANYGDSFAGAPLASVDKKPHISMEVKISEKHRLKEIAMGKLALAVKEGNGTYRRITDPVVIKNPEIIANNKENIFKGTSKKGLQGITYANYEGGSDIVDARNANTKQTLLNLDLSTVVSSAPRAGYTAYSYKGKTYYFSNLEGLKRNIQSLNYGYKQYLYGNSGRTPVAVSLCLLLSYNSENSYLIDPAARTLGHSYYMLNVREERARETLEALFLYLGETFGQSHCYVSNWILGNEINSSRAWNYSGGLDFDTYMECYVTAFRMLYTGVKAEKTGNTVSISLDNGWTASPDTYAGKTTLDTFAQKIQNQNAGIQWSIAYHGYSYPLTKADFWNDYHNTTDSIWTPYISMRNIRVLTDYAASLERTYGKPNGSIRVLLTEQGYSYSAGSWNQAMAIARGYYMAEFNDRIDAFIIRAVIDDPEEATGSLYFGLMNRRQDKRPAFYVYEYMDSDLNGFRKTPAEGTVSSANYDKFNTAKDIVCNTNWQSIIPGFNASKLAGIK